jgi:large conductance mechanosensitive channel
MENKHIVKKTPEKHENKELSINTKIIYFLAAFNVIGLAVGSVMGITAVSLGKSFTNEIIMPILSPILGADNWKNTRLKIWKFDLGIGVFISELIYFVIITLIMFFVVKVLFKKTIDKVIKRKQRWDRGLEKSQEGILNVLEEIRRA